MYSGTAINLLRKKNICSTALEQNTGNSVTYSNTYSSDSRGQSNSDSHNRDTKDSYRHPSSDSHVHTSGESLRNPSRESQRPGNSEEYVEDNISVVSFRTWYSRSTQIIFNICYNSCCCAGFDISLIFSLSAFLSETYVGVYDILYECTYSISYHMYNMYLWDSTSHSCGVCCKSMYHILAGNYLPVYSAHINTWMVLHSRCVLWLLCTRTVYTEHMQGRYFGRIIHPMQLEEIFEYCLSFTR